MIFLNISTFRDCQFHYWVISLEYLIGLDFNLYMFHYAQNYIFCTNPSGLD